MCVDCMDCPVASVLPYRLVIVTVINDIIWRAIKRAQEPAVKEPVSLTLEDNKRADGTTFLPWAKGKPLLGMSQSQAPMLQSHTSLTQCPLRGGSSSSGTTQDCQVFQAGKHSHMFYRIGIETAGTWDDMAIELVQEIGRRTTVITQDTRETAFLFQRQPIALQRGNTVSFLDTMNTE